MNRRISIAFAVAWALMIIVGVATLILPSWRASQAIGVELNELRDEIERSGNQPDVINDLTDRLAILQSFGDGRMTPIPEQSDIAGMMETLTRTLDEHGLTDREIKMGSVKELERASSIPMTVVVKGDFNAVFSAVREVESMDRLIRISRFRMGNDNGRPVELDRNGAVNGTLTMDVFFAPRDSEEQDS